MPYTQESGGRLNNFANEPKMYEATPPTTAEKRNYVFLGVAGALLVSGILAIAVAVSQAS
jgi:hypothetical protein